MTSLVDVKRRIRALLISVRGGCSLKQLHQDYSQVVGEGIPYTELGYCSLSEFLRDIPDVVAMRTSRDGRTVLHAVSDERTEHISRMVSKQKASTRAPSNVYVQPPPTRKAPGKRIPAEFPAQLKQLFHCYPRGVPFDRFNEAYARRFGHYLRFRVWGYSCLEQLLKDTGVVEIANDPLRGSVVLKPKKKSLTLQLDKKEDDLHGLETSPEKERSVEESLREAREKKTDPQPLTRPPIPDRLIRNISELLQANPAGIWLSQFTSQYKDYYGEELPVFTQGFSTPLHLLSSLPQCCSIERPLLGNGDWLVVEIGAIVKVAPNHAYLSSAYISDELTATIHRILAPAARGGAMLNSFLRIYKGSTGRELDIKDLGFNTLVQLLERVEGVSVMKPPDAEFMMVYGPKKKRGGGGSSENEEAPRPPGSMASAYTKQAVPGEKMFGVYVTHVHTPSCLCVQVIGETTTRTLEYLLEDLTQFYNSRSGDNYMLKNPLIGQPCCTLFNNDGYWYRAEVVGMPSSDIAEVLYVDYGNKGRVPATSLRKPKPHYMTLPAQAIMCRLAHLKPAGSMWSRQASSLLFQMTKDKPIVAIVSSIVDGLVSTSLCDTTTDQDIHINDTLVSQGLAIFVKDTEEEERKFDGYSPEPLPQGATENVPDVRAPSSQNRAPPLKVPSTNSSTEIPDLSPSLPASLQPPSALPTPPPTPAPPGLHGVTTPQNHTQLMQNYLLNLFLQQACVPGMTGLPPSSLAQLLTGQTGLNFPFLPPNPTTMANSVSSPQPAAAQFPQTSSTSSHNPVHPVDRPTNPVPPLTSHSTPELCDQAPPTRHTPNTSKSSAETQGRKREEKEERRPSSLPKLNIKKCQLTENHCLHVVQYNSRAHVLSPQVSLWFWDSDLLQSMLRQVQNSRPVWGLLLQEHRASELFREMKRDPQLRTLLSGRCEVTIYALEDLPTIVAVFHAPGPLCSAVRLESEQWLKKGLEYFTDPAHELEAVTAELKKLRAKRQEILESLAMEGRGDIDEGASALVKVSKAISKLKAERVELLKQSSSGCVREVKQEPASSLLFSSFGRNELGKGASQASDFDDNFYTCPSSQPPPTPDPTFPSALSSSQILPIFPEPSAVPLSPIRFSTSSSLCSLSDSSLSHILPQRKGTSTRDDVEKGGCGVSLPFIPTPTQTGRNTLQQEVRDRGTPAKSEEQTTTTTATTSVAAGSSGSGVQREKDTSEFPERCDYARVHFVPEGSPLCEQQYSLGDGAEEETISPTETGKSRNAPSAFGLDSTGPGRLSVNRSSPAVERGCHNHSSSEPEPAVERQRVIPEPVCTPSGFQHRQQRSPEVFRPTGEFQPNGVQARGGKFGSSAVDVLCGELSGQTSQQRRRRGSRRPRTNQFGTRKTSLGQESKREPLLGQFPGSNLSLPTGQDLVYCSSSEGLSSPSEMASHPERRSGAPGTSLRGRKRVTGNSGWRPVVVAEKKVDRDIPCEEWDTLSSATGEGDSDKREEAVGGGEPEKVFKSEEAVGEARLSEDGRVEDSVAGGSEEEAVEREGAMAAHEEEEEEEEVAEEVDGGEGEFVSNVMVEEQPDRGEVSDRGRGEEAVEAGPGEVGLTHGQDGGLAMSLDGKIETDPRCEGERENDREGLKDEAREDVVGIEPSLDGASNGGLTVAGGEDGDVERDTCGGESQDETCDQETKVEMEEGKEEEARAGTEVGGEISEEVKVVGSGHELLSGLEEWCREMERKGSSDESTELSGEKGHGEREEEREMVKEGDQALLVDLGIPEECVSSEGGKTPLTPASGVGSEGGNTPLTPASGVSSGAGKTPLTPASGVSSEAGKTPLTPASGVSSEGGKTPLTPAGGVSSEGGNTPLTPASGVSSEGGKTPLTPASGVSSEAGKTPLTPASGVSSEGGKTPLIPASGVSSEAGKTPLTPASGVSSGGGKTPLTPASGVSSEGGKTPLTPASGVSSEAGKTPLTPASGVSSEGGKTPLTPASGVSSGAGKTPLTPASGVSSEAGKTALTPASGVSSEGGKIPLTPASGVSSGGGKTPLTPAGGVVLELLGDNTLPESVGEDGHSEGDMMSFDSEISDPQREKAADAGERGGTEFVPAGGESVHQRETAEGSSPVPGAPRDATGAEAAESEVQFVPELVNVRIPPPFFRPAAVEWASKRLIGLGRGSPSNNPRAFILPGYPECQPYRPAPIVYDPSLFAPSPRYCPGSWQVLETMPP